MRNNLNAEPLEFGIPKKLGAPRGGEAINGRLCNLARYHGHVQ